MKFSLNIDQSREEEVIIYAHEIRPIFEEVKRLILNEGVNLIGYEADTIMVLPLADTACFITQNDKVFALVGDKKYLVKKRLYQIAELLDGNYLRLNQSCIGNVRQISKFKASFGGSLEVVFRNGYRDYVSRRELKHVKERIGIV